MLPQSGNRDLLTPLLLPHDLESLTPLDGESEIPMSQSVLCLISLAKYSTTIIIFLFFFFSLLNLESTFSPGWLTEMKSRWEIH